MSPKMENRGKKRERASIYFLCIAYRFSFLKKMHQHFERSIAMSLLLLAAVILLLRPFAVVAIIIKKWRGKNREYKKCFR